MYQYVLHTHNSLAAQRKQITFCTVKQNKRDGSVSHILRFTSVLHQSNVLTYKEQCDNSADTTTTTNGGLNNIFIFNPDLQFNHNRCFNSIQNTKCHDYVVGFPKFVKNI